MTESSKASKGNWDEDFNDDDKTTSTSTQSDLPKTEYMNLSKPGKYVVRLVGSHVRCRKHFKPYRITIQENEKDIDPAWQAGFYPSKRFAVNVIDRADGKLKVLEKGPQVFKAFAAYKAATDIDPSGAEGPNFAITVKVPKGDNGEPNIMKTEYSVVALEKAPLTDEDKKVVCKLDENGEIVKDDKGKPVSNLYQLRDIYKSTPAEKIQELWDALPDEKKVAPKKPWEKDKEETIASDSNKVEEKMDSAPADTSDMFASSNTEDESAELF